RRDASIPDVPSVVPESTLQLGGRRGGPGERVRRGPCVGDGGGLIGRIGLERRHEEPLHLALRSREDAGVGPIRQRGATGGGQVAPEAWKVASHLTVAADGFAEEEEVTDEAAVRALALPVETCEEVR